MSAIPVTCDCLNRCGDDPWLKDGRSQPCKHLLHRQALDLIAEQKAQAREPLYKFYGVSNIVDLVEAQATHIEKLQAKLTKLQPPMQIRYQVRKA